jgi:thiamine-monophosphate kinase
MKLEELGERGLIERITRKFQVDNRLVTAVAGEDDCAVIDLERARNGYRYLVVTTDSLQQSTHFPPGITPFQMGWSAVAVNLSDIAAMGAEPFAFVIAMGVPEQTGASFMDELTVGIEACASTYDTAVVGGDITRSNELILTGTCFGFANDPVRRAGANVGDLLCVTGSLGNAALALKIINNELKAPQSIAERAKKALFQPQPRVQEGLEIANSGVVTSMIDISDGLALSIAEIAKSSNVGAELYEDRIPIFSEEIRDDRNLHLTKGERRELALYYGGDYELLFSLNTNALGNEAVMQKLRNGVNMSIIGTIVPPEEGIYLKKGREMREPLEIKGYQHF